MTRETKLLIDMWDILHRECHKVVTEENYDAIKKSIKVLEQEQKTGHWKRISIDKYSEHAKYWYRCDKCGKDNLGDTDWCPNCGAKMEGGAE